MILEICCGGYEDAENAYAGGADRIELNCSLALGGLTPSIGTLIQIRKNFKIKTISMVRPRGSGFCYSESEFKAIYEDTCQLMKNGSDGIAFGFLNQNRTVNVMRTKMITELIHDMHGEAVFHRAFDCSEDPFASMQQLIDIGIDRVLTSGMENTAFEGTDLLAELQKKYGSRIEILAGSGVSTKNIGEIIRRTGLSQFHSSCKTWKSDPTASGNHVSFSYSENGGKDCYEAVDAEKVAALKKEMHNFDS